MLTEEQCISTGLRANIIPAVRMLLQPRKLTLPGNEQEAGKWFALMLCIFSLFNQQFKGDTEE